MDIQTIDSNLDSLEKSKLLELIQKQQHEITRLQDELDGDVTTLPTEQRICAEQIRYLNQLSMVRELTTEETKKFEIFAKTLNMLRGNDIKASKSKSKKSLPDVDKLLKIAQKEE